jgi:glycine/D-amino acid oxidase-like deaminating enzyme
VWETDFMAAGASVVVVGGGVMGCSIAFHLAERGVDVLVLERGHGLLGHDRPLGGWAARTLPCGQRVHPQDPQASVTASA